MGTVIQDRFLVVERIAAGGMGVVYKAEQVPLGRPVALKILESKHNEQIDSHFSERFFLEAAAVAKLSHPNTIVLYDYGRTEDDLYYYAMEYVEGTTLTRRIFDHGPLAPKDAIHVALQIGGSLRDAHDAGMVHRDLKPGNVMLTSKGGDDLFVKVLDFGLVKVMGQDVGVELTKSGMLMGSPRYMAPEQVTGRPVDRRADVYSLGTVLYHALTGAPPFQQESQYEVLRAQVEAAPPPLRATYPACAAGPRLEALVEACLEKHKEQRPQDMNEVLAELVAAAREEGVEDLSMSSSCRPVGVTASQEIRTRASSSGESASVSVQAPIASGERPALSGSSPGAPTASDPGSSSSAELASKESGIGRKLAIVAVLLAAGVLAAVLAFVIPEGEGEAVETPASVPVANEPSDPRVEPVQLGSDPTGARVRRGDEDLGDTPVTLSIPAGERWDVTLSRDGYQSRTLTIASGRGAMNVRLTPVEADEPEVEAPADRRPSRRRGARGATSAEPAEPDEAEPTETEEPASPTTDPTPSNEWRRSSDNRDPWAQ